MSGGKPGGGVRMGEVSVPKNNNSTVDKVEIITIHCSYSGILNKSQLKKRFIYNIQIIYLLEINYFLLTVRFHSKWQHLLYYHKNHFGDDPLL